MKKNTLYLVHIQECIVRIEQYIVGGKNDFLASIKTQDAVLRNLHTLAESTQRLSSALQEEYPMVDWSAIAGFRNVIVHDYLGVDLEQIWRIVEQDLPLLKLNIGQMLAKDR